MRWYKNEDGSLKCFGLPGDWIGFCQRNFHCGQLESSGDCNEDIEKDCLRKHELDSIKDGENGTDAGNAKTSRDVDGEFILLRFPELRGLLTRSEIADRLEGFEIVLDV